MSSNSNNQINSADNISSNLKSKQSSLKQIIIGIITKNPNSYTCSEIIKKIEMSNCKTEIINPLTCSINIRGKKAGVYDYSFKQLKPDIIIPRVTELTESKVLELVNLFTLNNVYVLNSESGIKNAISKIRTLTILSNNGISVPQSILINSTNQMDFVLKKINLPLIIKPVSGSRGIGVLIIKTKSEFMSSIEYFLSNNIPFIVQKYIDGINKKDLRSIVLGNDILCSYERTVPVGEFRSNLHRGGNIIKNAKISKKDSSTILSSVRALKLNFAAVDYIKTRNSTHILEINCSPGIKGPQKILKINLLDKLIKYLLCNY